MISVNFISAMKINLLFFQAGEIRKNNTIKINELNKLTDSTSYFETHIS